MVKSVNVPTFDSKDMTKEVGLVINGLKTNPDKYFQDAKRIIKQILAREEYKNRDKHDILKTVEFNRTVKEAVKEYLVGNSI